MGGLVSAVGWWAAGVCNEQRCFGVATRVVGRCMHSCLVKFLVFSQLDNGRFASLRAGSRGKVHRRFMIMCALPPTAMMFFVPPVALRRDGIAPQA